MSDHSQPSIPKPDAAALDELIRDAALADAQPPFSDGALVALSNGEREYFRLHGGIAIYSDTEAEFAVHPSARREGVGTAILERLISVTPGDLLVWAHGDHPGARALAQSHGLTPVRTLLHLSAPVPQGAANPGPTRLGTAPFRVGADEGVWVLANARAFAQHPEQGRMTRADLAVLEKEPWFDPSDFLMLWDDDQLLAYCWLKVEGDRGEFYAVGVDPLVQHCGLGKRMVAAGLARLAQRGIHTAHLYVEADNEAALHLYKGFGFEQDSIDVQYRLARQN